MACISLPTAMLIGGGLSAAGGLASAVIGSSASTKAAELQSEAAKEAAQVTKDQFAVTQSNLKPYMSAGVDAIPQLKGLLGLPGGTDMNETLKNLPGYQFQLQQGLQATQNGFAAKGLGQSGAALKGAANYAEGLAGTSYQALFQNVLQSVGLGQNAAATLGTQGLGYTNAQNSLTTGGAAAEAAGTVGSANSIIGGLNTAIGGVSNAIVTPAMLQLLSQNGGFGGNTGGTGGGLYSLGGTKGTGL